MYTDKKNILQLVALLEAHGITKVVLCPGSRNTPIVHTLSNHPNFTCYPVTDERSAGYFAIGLALNGGKPAAVCCTSGTALLNLHPLWQKHFIKMFLWSLFLRIVPLPGSGRWMDRQYHNQAYFRHWLRSR